MATDSESKVPVVIVDYDEHSPETYRGIVVSLGSKIRMFKGSGFKDDYVEAQDWMLSEGYESWFESVTVQNYLSDVKSTSWIN